MRKLISVGTMLYALWAVVSLGEVNVLAQVNGGIVVDEPVKAMSRNVYVGANIFRVTSQTDPLLILSEIAAVYQTTQETNFTARAEVLADEMLLHQPHVVGLQEVALIRRQSPGDVLQGNPISATEVETDYLQVLLDALSVRGLDYVVAASIDNADIELPLVGATLDDIRLTDRDVLLVRADVPFVQAAANNYSDKVVIDLAGTLINFDRGYTTASVTIGDSVYRVVNTHLEVGSQGTIQSLQVSELINLLQNEPLPTILLGDFNSSPQSPDGEAYSQLIDVEFTDVWTIRSIDDTDPGFTCCHAETLLDPASVFTSRIDLVMTRFNDLFSIDPVTATVTGEDPGLRTPDGLWPSDHGGVIVELTVLNNAPDADGDGIKDNADNCVQTINTAQQDSDADGYGNVCDADYDQNNTVNFLDLAIFAQLFNSTNALADLNNDGFVNFLDFALVRSMFFAAPGPSGLNPER